jgi:microcystin-dependent protein
MGGRTPIGAMAAGEGQDDNTPGATPDTAGLTHHALGDLLGEETHSLTVAEMASHTHGYKDRHWTGSESSDWGAGHAMSDDYVDTARSTGFTGGVDTNNDAVPDAAAGHNNMQPSMVLKFMIKY